MANQKTFILSSKPPISWWRNNWIPRYSDNPAMRKWFVPSKDNVIKQYNNMIQAILETGNANLLEIDFPNTKDLESCKKIEELQNFTKEKILSNSFFVNPNWEDLIDKNWELTQHDFVFVRDSFISNQNDKIIISHFSQKAREVEETIIKEILYNLIKVNWLNRELIVPPKNIYLEWWDFRYIPKDKILFAGKSWRNSKDGVDFVKSNFEINPKDILIIDWNWFHLDTYFSVFTDNEWNLKWWIICKDLVKNFNEVKKFFKEKQKRLIEIPSSYWIGRNGDGNWHFATNTLQLWEYLIGCKYFDDGTELILDKEWIKRIITKMNQYTKSWWAIHCSTNQI